CACTPAPIHLMDCGLFACSPVAPTLTVDLHVLEFMRMLFVHLTPNMTAWSETLKSFLDAQGYQLESKVCCIHETFITRLFVTTCMFLYSTSPFHIFH
ncbi:hypothetical protein EV401DRAFT_1881536, partial [Pisolithus croceorrhizus]